MRRRSFLLLLSVVALALTLPSPAQAGNEVVFRESSVNFGSAKALGSPDPFQVLHIDNHTSGAVTYSGTSKSGTATAEYDVNDFCPSTIAAFGSCSLVVYFDPDVRGTRGPMTLTASTSWAGVVSTTLTGTGTQPNAVADHASGHNFGAHEVGTSTTETFGLSNLSPSNEVLDYTVTTDSAEFTVAPASPAPCGTSPTNNILAIGSSCGLHVTFSPTTPGSKTATLTWTTDDPSHPFLQRTLTASTTPNTTIGRITVDNDRNKAKVKLRSDTDGATFECNLDGAGFLPCTNPAIFKHLTRGLHTLAARAISGALVDPTPAEKTFRVR